MPLAGRVSRGKHRRMSVVAPPPVFTADLLLPSPEATAGLARWLAPRMLPGDVLLLDGPIGAGKTHFARALIQHLLAAAGCVEDVPSPSFTLVQTYHAAALEIWHADLFRLTGPDDVTELGLTDAFATALCLVEWPDRLGALAPPGALDLRFTLQAGDRRHLELSTRSPRWSAVIAEAADHDA